MLGDCFRRSEHAPVHEPIGLVVAAASSVAAMTAASLVLAASAGATLGAGSEKTALRVVAFKAPARLVLDRPASIAMTVANRGRKTVPTVAVWVSVGLIPDPGFKITWATARSGALKPGASRSFTFHIKVSSRFDKDHTDKVSGQTVSFYGAGNYVIEACTGPTLNSDEACRESRTITAS